MAGRGYMTTAVYSSGYNNGAVLQEDDEERSRLEYVEYERIGDVYRPVTGNADRGYHPLAFLNSDTPAKYVAVRKTERVVERVRVPVADYENRFPARDYGTRDRSYYKPEKYDVVVDHDRKFSRNDYEDTKYKEKAYDDRKFPTSDNGSRRYRPETYEYDLDHDRRPPGKVEDDVAQPIVRNSVASKTTTKWPASPALTGPDSHAGWFGFSFSIGKVKDKPSKDRKTKNENHPENQTRKNDRIVEPTPPAAWTTNNHRPTRVRLSGPQNQMADSKTNLLAATNNINIAMEYLMKAANPSTDLHAASSTLPQRRSAVPPVLKTDPVSDSSGNHYIEENPGYCCSRSPYKKVPVEQYAATSK